jgi:hypothetical protein
MLQFFQSSHQGLGDIAAPVGTKTTGKGTGNCVHDQLLIALWLRFLPQLKKVRKQLEKQPSEAA